MIFQYNPYATQGSQVPGQAGNPFGQANQEAKKISVPTWLLALIILAFIGGAIGLWFLL